MLIVDRVTPEEWQLGIVGKGKGDASETEVYTRLKLTDILLETAEVDIKRQQVDINEVQFGFMPGCGTKDAIFTLRKRISTSHL